MNLVTDIVAQSLDAAGIEYVEGDIQDGTRPMQVSLRAYSQCLRQLLRAAHWDFARRSAPLLLLADASGQTANVGTVVPFGPFQFEYAYPQDCAKVRFIPQNWGTISSGIPSANIQIPTTPLTTAGTPLAPTARIIPARFVIATDPNYAPQPGAQSWETQGVSPAGRTVILTNVKDAQCVYTQIMLYPSTWDPLFRMAMVAYLASEVAFPLATWKSQPGEFLKRQQMGMAIRRDQIAIAKDKIREARAADGNEAFTSSDLSVDWMQVRRTGSAGWGNGGPYGVGTSDGGCGGYGWDACGFADGTAF